MTDELRWAQVLARDARLGAPFVYAVRSTGIYCRPTCPSRRPRRREVLFFDAPAAAERAGFRACRRCRPNQATAEDPAAASVRRACEYLEAHADEPVSLRALAAHVGWSASHLGRAFKRLMGVSPRQYLEARRFERLRKKLREKKNVTDALYEAGFSSSSRLYERANGRLGMTPKTYSQGGAGMAIRYTIVDSPLGRLLLAGTERGVCRVAMGNSDRFLENDLRQEFPVAERRRDDAALGPWARAVVEHLRGHLTRLDLPLDIRATAFQERVWAELRRIPFGQTLSYSEVAKRIGRPSAVRAVARACATNPVALIVPCHRVVGSDGKLHGYYWGLERKKALLEQERKVAQGRRAARG